MDENTTNPAVDNNVAADDTSVNPAPVEGTEVQPEVTEENPAA